MKHGSLRRERMTGAFEADLRADIRGGRLKPGDLVLSIAQICGRYGLKPGAVQKAIGRMEAEGLLETRHGSGTFVAAAAQPHAVRLYLAPASPLREFYEARIRDAGFAVSLAAERPGADLASVAGVGVHLHAGVGGLEPVDARIRASAVCRGQDWLEGVRERYVVGGQAYAVPVYASPIVLFYNAAAFRKAALPPPSGRWKWPDLLKAVRGLRVGCDTERAGVLPFFDQFSFYVPFLAQNGASVFPPGGGCGLAAAEAVESIEFLRALHARAGGLICRDRNEMIDHFVSGRSALLIWSAHLVSRLTRERPFEWGWVGLPGQKRRATLFFSEGLAIPRGGPAGADPAWRFVEACVACEAQRFFAANAFPFPARRSAARAFVRRHGPGYARMLKEIGAATTEHYAFPHLFETLNRQMAGILDPARDDAGVRTQCNTAAQVLASLAGMPATAHESLIA